MLPPGTTWLEEMVYLIYNKGDTALANQMPNYIRVPYLEDHRTTQLCANQPRPRLYKSHLRYNDLPTQVQDKNAKVVHIIRDPRDVAVSYYYFYKSLEELGNYTSTWDEYFRMFISGHVVFGSWFEYVGNWWAQRHNSNILFLRYEKMLEDPFSNIEKIAQFCEFELGSDQIQGIVDHCSFKAMKENPMTNFSSAKTIDANISPFMRKGIAGDWKSLFTPQQKELFEDILRKEMTGVGWDFT